MIPRRESLAVMTAAATALSGASIMAKELDHAEAAAVGMDKAALARLSAHMKAFVDQNRRAGVVYGVVRRGKLVALEAFGHASVEKNLPMGTDSVFRLYSQSRAVTGAAILTLVEEGKLKLDDPVAKYIPEIADMKVIKEVKDGQVTATEPQKTPMTVRHLFTYTAGLGYANDWPKGVGIQQRDILALDKTIAEGVKKLSTYPLLFQPGAKWYYGFSSDVLGRVAEVASGQPLNVFLQQRLFDHVGMPDTGYWVKEGEADRLADIYGPDDTGKMINRTAMAPTSSTYTKPGKMFSAGGGLVSTATDYLRFLQMLLNGGELDGARILKPETVKMMLTRQTTPEQGLVYWYNHNSTPVFRGYAWGLAIGVRAEEGPHAAPGSPGDAAWGGLANTAYFLDPQEQIAAVALTQYLGPDEPALALTLRNGVYGAIIR
ncbi:MAG: serine hydrolase domain-containing protein [Rhodospirillaceae bacterium]|nr:serine hydrolase domain-containing protein [Rhodospirillaceae bacterium]